MIRSIGIVRNLCMLHPLDSSKRNSIFTKKEIPIIVNLIPFLLDIKLENGNFLFPHLNDNNFNDELFYEEVFSFISILKSYHKSDIDSIPIEIICLASVYSFCKSESLININFNSMFRHKSIISDMMRDSMGITVATTLGFIKGFIQNSNIDSKYQDYSNEQQLFDEAEQDARDIFELFEESNISIFDANAIQE
jgi:hypothetical protein